MIKRIIIKGFSKKFKGVQKLPAQKAPKFKPDPGEAATKEFTKKFGEKPQFMGFSERASTSMAAESLASRTAGKKWSKGLTKEIKKQRSTIASFAKTNKSRVSLRGIKKAKTKGFVNVLAKQDKEFERIRSSTQKLFTGSKGADPFKTYTKKTLKKFVSKEQKKTWGF